MIQGRGIRTPIFHKHHYERGFDTTRLEAWYVFLYSLYILLYDYMYFIIWVKVEIRLLLLLLEFVD